MQIYKLETEQFVSLPCEEVFSFFSDPRNLDRITPPWLQFRTVDMPPALYRGCLIIHKLRLHGFPITWVSQILEWDPPHRFVDMQVLGPYKFFHHTHEFEPMPSGTLIRDRIYYALPLGWLGRLAHRLFVRRDLENIFNYRRQMIERLLAPT